MRPAAKIVGVTVLMLGGSAELPRRRCTLPARHLDDVAGALQHAAVARALLLDPVAPAVLRARAPVLRPRTRRAAQGPGRGAAEELRMVES